MPMYHTKKVYTKSGGKKLCTVFTLTLAGGMWSTESLVLVEQGAGKAPHPIWMW